MFWNTKELQFILNICNFDKHSVYHCLVLINKKFMARTPFWFIFVYFCSIIKSIFGENPY